MVIRRERKTVYVCRDGVEFEKKQDAMRHEAEIAIAEIVHSQSNQCGETWTQEDVTRFLIERVVVLQPQLDRLRWGR